MLLVFLYFLMILFLLMIMMIMNFLISKKMFKNREKITSFECGFDSMSLNRMPFSLQFYLIGILFLIFDIEIVMILPMIKSINFNNFIINLNFLMIILILLFGLLMEWKEGALIWFK